jgi:hypothetical protein
MRTLTYTKAHHLATLHAELNAAGYHPWPVVGEEPARPFHLELGFPDDFADDAGVEAVVMAHDRAAALAAYDAARQAEQDDNAQARQVLAQLTSAIDGWPAATNAQKLDAVLLCLRVCRVLVRLALRRLG